MNTGNVAMIVDYVTSAPISDTASLKAQADELLDTFATQADAQGAKVLVFRANEKAAGVMTALGGYARFRTFGVVYERTPGGWRHFASRRQAR